MENAIIRPVLVLYYSFFYFLQSLISYLFKLLADITYRCLIAPNLNTENGMRFLDLTNRRQRISYRFYKFFEKVSIKTGGIGFIGSVFDNLRGINSNLTYLIGFDRGQVSENVFEVRGEETAFGIPVHLAGFQGLHRMGFFQITNRRIDDGRVVLTCQWLTGQGRETTFDLREVDLLPIFGGVPNGTIRPVFAYTPPRLITLVLLAIIIAIVVLKTDLQCILAFFRKAHGYP